VVGADGIDEGLPKRFAGRSVAKLPPGSPIVVHAGGGAGGFSAIIEGWLSGPRGSQPVTRVIGT